LYQHVTNDFHNGTIRTISITPPFQHTGIARLQAERKHIERHIGASLIDDTDNSERHTHLAQPHTIGTNRFANDSSNRRRKQGHITDAFGNVMNALFGQFQSVILRITFIHSRQVVGIGSQYLLGIVLCGIGQHQQHLVYLICSASHQRATGFADILENFCHFSHTHSKYK
jgi:hypothetical protein